MTTTAQARRTVMLGLAATSGIAAVNEIREGDMPSPRILVGAIVAGLTLTALAGPLPGVAAGITLIALIATAVVVGPETFQFPTGEK